MTLYNAALISEETPPAASPLLTKKVACVKQVSAFFRLPWSIDAFASSKIDGTRSREAPP